MATLWDISSPADLTGFSRAAVEDAERARGSLAPWLPNQSVPDVVVRTVVGADGNGELAQYRSFDAETPIGSGGKGTRKVFELLPLGLKERVSEYEQLRLRGGDAAALIVAGVDRAALRVANAVVDRLEVARGQVLETGKLTISENGVQQVVDFARPASCSVTAATLWSEASAKPLEDLIAWTDAWSDANGGTPPGALVMSKRVVAALQRSPEIRGLLSTATGAPSMVSIDAMNAALSSFGLPPVVIYDRRVRGQRIFSDNKVLILPAPVEANGQSMLGATFFGQTLEGSEPEYGLSPVDQPGLVVGAWKTRDPMAGWVHANAIALPVVVNPVASMVATVL